MPLIESNTFLLLFVGEKVPCTHSSLLYYRNTLRIYFKLVRHLLPQRRVKEGCLNLLQRPHQVQQLLQQLHLAQTLRRRMVCIFVSICLLCVLCV